MIPYDHLRRWLLRLRIDHATAALITLRMEISEAHRALDRARIEVAGRQLTIERLRRELEAAFNDDSARRPTGPSH